VHFDPASERITEGFSFPTPLARRGATVADVVVTLAAQRTALRPGAVAQAPWQAADVLPGPVTGLLPDGDFLWVLSRASLIKWNPHRLLLWHQPTRRWVAQCTLDYRPALAADDQYLWFPSAEHLPDERYTTARLCRVEKQRAYDAALASSFAADDAATQAAFEKLSVRDRAFNHFAAGQYAEAAALFAQVRPTPYAHPGIVEAAAEALFMQALCFDAEGLRDAGKQREFLQHLLDRYPDDPLCGEARRRLVEQPARP
jgi:hypothetical protein